MDRWPPRSRAGAPVLAVGLLLTALAYLGAVPDPAGRASVARAAPSPGSAGIALIPSAPAGGQRVTDGWYSAGALEPLGAGCSAGSVALGGPLRARLVRSGAACRCRCSALGAWAIAGPFLASAVGGVVPYLWAGVLSLGLIGWGVVERRTERINLGVAGFALTVLVFYFSSVMDRLGRSASLVGLGLLFLGGGWALERVAGDWSPGSAEAEP